MFAPEALAEYERCFADADARHAMLEDYRAGLGIDRHNDESDRAVRRRIECPTLVLSSTDDDLEQIYGDPVEVWRPWCRQVEGHGIKSGHHMAEQAPEDLAQSLIAFLRHQPSTNAVQETGVDSPGD